MFLSTQLSMTTNMYFGAVVGTLGFGARRSAPPPHSLRTLLGLSPRHIFAARYVKLLALSYLEEKKQ